ncbi:CFS1-like protein [Vararia minispora EC-137]|uniref:CFS1-like protein n=1 Tax=Vararia minispora EC-137 TaxID=1314806 RepID=A0ACB8QI62_9AGAM|nr:CFS1-like protein [Vararia minispora EC-137]
MFSTASSSALWPSVTTFAKATLQSVLRDGIRRGQLVIEDAEGTHTFGDVSGAKCKVVSMRIVNENFWARVYLRHDLGFAEAYMYGDFEAPDLKALLDLWLDNREHLDGLSSVVSRVMHGVSSLALRLFGQTLSNAKLNAIAGYDCCNELFEAFLGDTMMYSSALWPDSTGGVRGDLEALGPAESDLDNAQLSKLHYILRKARVRPGDRVLEFGTGWGSMAIEAAKQGCMVDTLTLSKEQKAYAEARILKLGLQERIRIHLMDYRQLPPDFEKAFDAFVSVEMVEHVGYRYLPDYFKIIDWALKSDRAAAVVTATTQPDSRFTTFQPSDFAREYIWPNAFCPSPITLAGIANTATQSHFNLDSIEDFAHHYPRTLREWGYRFQRNWNDKLISAIVKAQPQLSTPEDLAIYKRRWEYMFVYAEVGFARAYTSMTYWTFVRPENVVQRCD